MNEAWLSVPAPPDQDWIEVYQVDWLTFLAAETNALAWPVLAGAIVILTRKQIPPVISELLGRLKSAKGGGFELSFGEQIDQVQQSLPAIEHQELAQPQDKQSIDQRAELAHLPPSYIISQAWLRVEEELSKSVRSIAITTAPQRMHIPQSALIKLAVDREIITSEEHNTLNQLRALRNQAAHSLDPNISLTDALRYDDIVNTLVKQIRSRV